LSQHKTKRRNRENGANVTWPEIQFLSPEQIILCTGILRMLVLWRSYLCVGVSS